MRGPRLLRLMALVAAALFVTFALGAMAANTHAQAAPSSPSGPNVQFQVVTTTTTTTVPVTTTTVTVPNKLSSSTRGPLPLTGAPLEQWLLFSIVLIGTGSLLILATQRGRARFRARGTGAQSSGSI